MTSKALSSHKGDFIKIQRELLKRRVWLIALTSFLLFLFYVVLNIIYLAEQRQTWLRMVNNGQSTDTLKVFMTRASESVLGFSSGDFSFAIPVILLAMVAGAQGYFFLYKTRSTDFYLSIPLTRKRLFNNIFVCGILIYAAISLVFTVIGTLICAGFGGMNASLALQIFLEYLRLLNLYFAVYSVTVLSVLISKNYYVAIIVDIVFLMGQIAISGLLKDMSQNYYVTYYNPGNALNALEYTKIHILSPIWNHISGVMVVQYKNYYGTARAYTNLSKEVLGKLFELELSTLIFGAAVCVLSYYAFTVRRAEDIGSGVTSRIMEFAIKMLVTIPVGVFAFYAIDSILRTINLGLKPYPLLMLFVAVAITSVIGQIICEGSIKASLKRLWHIIPAFLGALIIVLIYKFDLTGYNTYIPNINKVEDCTLIVYGGGREYPIYVENYYATRMMDDYFISNMHLKNVIDVVDVAVDGQNTQVYNAEQNAQSYLNGENTPDLIKGYAATVSYRLKNGKHVFRSILIPEAVDADIMDRIVGSEEYKNVTYALDDAVNMVGAHSMHGVLSYSTGFEANIMNAEPALFEEFVENYKRDMEKYDYSFAKSENPIGDVMYYEASLYGEGYYAGNLFSLTYEIYPSYTNTIEFLKKNGIYEEPGIPTGRVTDMSVMGYIEVDGKYYHTGTVYNDLDKIKELAEKAKYISNVGMWSRRDLREYYDMYINVVNDKGYVEEYGSYFLPKEAAPEYVDDDLMESYEYGEANEIYG